MGMEIIKRAQKILDAFKMLMRKKGSMSFFRMEHGDCQAIIITIRWKKGFGARGIWSGLNAWRRVRTVWQYFPGLLARDFFIEYLS